MNQNSNPVFRNIQKNTTTNTYVEVTEATASWKGIILKTLLLAAVAIVAGILVWFLPVTLVYVLVAISPIVAFICVIFGMRRPAKTHIFAIIYSLFQGLTFGTLTYLLEEVIPGIGMMALGITFGILLIMIGLHSIKAVRATSKLRRFILGSLIAIMLTSLVVSLISLINPTLFAAIFADPAVMIIVSAFLIIIGALMLITDFDNGNIIVNSGAPKMYEWQVSLGLMVTLVWIYVRVLDLLRIVLRSRSRNN